MHLTHYLYFTLSMNLLICGKKPDNNLKDGTVDGETLLIPTRWLSQRTKIVMTTTQPSIPP